MAASSQRPEELNTPGDLAVQARRRLRAAMEARDLEEVRALLAPGVVLYSPIIPRRFEGRQAVGDLIAAILDSFGDFHYTAEMAGAESQMLAFRAVVRGRAIDGVDLLRVDADGQIEEIVVFIRPMSGLAAVAAALGPRLARRRGRPHALLMRLLGPPLPLLLGVLNVLAPRLIPLRSDAVALGPGAAKSGRWAMTGTGPLGYRSTGGGASEYVSERKRNPFVGSQAGGRVLSAGMLPWFALLPPAGFGVLTTTGRKTGKARPKCVRAIRRGNRAYLVVIGGARAAWLKNIRTNPDVRLRIRGGTLTGVAREVREPAEREHAAAAYCETVNPFDYVGCAMHRPGRPTRSKIEELHRSWFDNGVPLVVELGA